MSAQELLLTPSGREPKKRGALITNATETFETTTYHKVDVRLLPFLFLCYILAYLDRVTVGVSPR
jgi:hypothetical protein